VSIARRSSMGVRKKTYGHGKPFEEWEVVLKDHHEGYIDWAEFEREPETARGERLWSYRRCQIQSWRPGAAGWSASLRPMWPSRLKVGLLCQGS
jgi:hypothetical protein